MGVSGISIISFLDFISIKAFSDFAVIQQIGFRFLGVLPGNLRNGCCNFALCEQIVALTLLRGDDQLIHWCRNDFICGFFTSYKFQGNSNEQSVLCPRIAYSSLMKITPGRAHSLD